MGLSLILPHDLPKGANNAAADSTEPPNIVENLDDEYLWKLTSPDKSNPLSLNEISAKAERVKKCLFDLASNIEAIKSTTRDQHNSMLWYNVRKPRITASQGRCLLKGNTSPTKAISEVLIYKPRVQTCHMKKGIEMEPMVIDRFSQETGNTVRKCGFFVSESHPYLGASPDGITEKGNLIEVKYVTSKGESMEETLCILRIYKNGINIELNNKHKYYHQVQQQLFCSNYMACHFVVSNGIWLHSEVVEFNNAFWNNVVTQLETFYFTNIFPELVYPRVLYNEPRWNKVIPFPIE